MVKSAFNKFNFSTGFESFHCIRARFTAIFEGAFEADPDMKRLIGKVAEFGHACQNEPFVWELIVSRIKDKNEEDEVNRKLRKLSNRPGIVFEELDLLNLRDCIDLMLSAKEVLTELESNTPMGYRLKIILIHLRLLQEGSGRIPHWSITSEFLEIYRLNRGEPWIFHTYC